MFHLKLKMMCINLSYFLYKIIIRHLDKEVVTGMCIRAMRLKLWKQNSDLISKNIKEASCFEIIMSIK